MSIKWWLQKEKLVWNTTHTKTRIETCLLQPHGCKQISIMISEVSLKQINNTEHCNIDSRTM